MTLPVLLKIVAKIRIEREKEQELLINVRNEKM